MPAARTTAPKASATPADTTPETPAHDGTQLGAFQAAFEAMGKTNAAKMDAKLGEFRREFLSAIDDVMEVIESKKTEEPDEDAPDLTELAGLVNGLVPTVNGLVEGRVSPVEFEQLSDRIRELEETTPVTSAPLAAPVAYEGVPLVHGRVLELMREIEAIGKSGLADFGKGASRVTYNFRGVDAALDAVGTAMRKVGLVMVTEVVDKEITTTEVPRFYQGKQEGTTIWTTTHVTMRYTFIDPRDGSKHSVEGLGEGRDNADKGSPKALAGAMKYALLHGLCIPVNGLNVDSESGHPVIETDNAPPADYVPDDDYSAPVGQGQQPPPQPAPVEPLTDPEARRRAARSALDAAREAQMTLTKLKKIHDHAMALTIHDEVIEETQLLAHLIAIRHTLSAQQGAQQNG